MPSGLELFEWLIGLTPAVVPTARITVRCLILQEFSRSCIGEKERAEADNGCKGFGCRFCIGHGEGIRARIGLFAGDDEIQLKGVAVVTA